MQECAAAHASRLRLAVLCVCPVPDYQRSGPLLLTLSWCACFLRLQRFRTKLFGVTHLDP